MCVAGKGSPPPSLNAIEAIGAALGFRRSHRAGGSEEPRTGAQPTEVITYCSPFAVNVTGMESIADLVWIDKLFAGVRGVGGEFASALALKTRLPAVATTASVDGNLLINRPPSVSATGSQAISLP